ncbi:unnamed protein product [Toxocara canis]|uniref:G_PROTEIN_RECEP_F1_2 domain-containing protein n=1 Tax=Toxocara canis TaxID=6265 RepID=A0A183USP7_TOXCA|nr:unnamed protein product [Toxocara canis]
MDSGVSPFDENSIVKQKWINATDEEKRHFILALRAKVEITDVLPPPNHEDLHVLIMAGAYMLLFLLGTCGNSAVLTTIYHVIRSGRATLDNTLIYVIVLSCVDFGVCISLPFTVIDQILGFWMFGTVVCKLHAVLENFGKILSALILTAMSFDRYAGVCHPQKKWLRSRKLAVCILVGLAAYALVTLCPLLWSFTARELVLFEKETAPYKLTRMRIEKCTMVNISSVVFTMFTIYQCILCYCFPLFLVAFFYSKLLHRLRQHARQFKSSHIPLMRISLYTLAVACFYFLCWTPFWIATVFAVYLEYAGEQSGSVPPVFVYCMYFIHALPFTNSAVNWILYAKANIDSQMLPPQANGLLPHFAAYGEAQTDHVPKSSGNFPDKSIESLCKATCSDDDRESVPLTTNDSFGFQTLSDSFDPFNDISVRLMIANDPTYL